MNGKKPTTKNIISSNALIQIWQRNQKLYRQAKVNRIQHHQTSFITNAKGTFLDWKQKKREQENRKDLQAKTNSKMAHIYW